MKNYGLRGTVATGASFLRIQTILHHTSFVIREFHIRHSLLLFRSHHLEKIRRVAVPIRRAHPPHRVIGLLTDAQLLRIKDRFLNMDAMDDSEDEAVAADLLDRVDLALQRGGRIRDPRRGNQAGS